MSILNKNRIEALSDGVFAIVMTLLIIDIKVPISHGGTTDAQLWERLFALIPLFKSYIISFLILGVYWTAHHAFFNFITKSIDRRISYLNIVFLMFVACIPFSAHLLGEYPAHQPAMIVYGSNIIIVGLLLYWKFRLVVDDTDKRHEHVSKRLIIQATIRILLPPVFAFFGILVSYVNLSWSYFLFFFPIIFNLVPGGLDFLEGLYKKVKKISVSTN